MNVLIWGAGNMCGRVCNELAGRINIVGIIDSNIDKQGKIKDEIKIISPEQIFEIDFDYIVVSVIKDGEIENYCKRIGLNLEKVIFYWRDSLTALGIKNRFVQLINAKYKIQLLEARLDSYPYEYGIKSVPNIKSAKELLEKILKEGFSLCRFGDGEFEIMRGKNRAWFETMSCSLQERLIQIFWDNSNSKILTAAAQNFKNFEGLKEDAADIIRMYMEGETRTDILSFFNESKEYYDAYVSRPYIFYKNSDNANIIFSLFKQIWEKRNIVMVEGAYGRAGIANDLFDGVKSIKRVVCPKNNAWEYYEQILESVLCVVNKDDLVCISLGPTATVLAYDLAQKGIQALDIGQVDNEYDWYLQKSKKREPIKGKMAAEVLDAIEDIQLDESIEKQHRSQVCCYVIGDNL